MGRTWKTTVIAGMLVAGLPAFGCRATVAGDPDRPIRIEAHVTIDVRQIKEEAHSIEDLVSGEPPKNAQKPQSFLMEGLVPSAWAQAGLAPEVEQAIQSRRDRFPQLKNYKAQGWVGEDNQGHTVALGGGLEVRALVEAENQDREIIYRAKLKEKNLPEGALATIRAAFAEEQRERAQAGEKIQTPSGEWVTK